MNPLHAQESTHCCALRVPTWVFSSTPSLTQQDKLDGSVDQRISYGLKVFGPLYPDQADCENGFDELKTRGTGFTTQDIERCQTSARAVALVYN